MRTGALVALVAVVPLWGCPSATVHGGRPAPLAEWPTAGWRVSTPEQQGMDSAVLVEMMDHYRAQQQALAAEGQDVAIDSVTIVRNGVIVADFYPNPHFPRDTPHVIHSCTKSIVSALIGIAIEDGLIAGIDTPVLEFFPDKAIDNLDDRKRAITVGDLLTMQTGLDSRDSYLFEWRGLFAMQETDDWVQHALSLPMDAEPGTRFDYSNISTFLLSAIITQVTGEDALSYAQKKLFAPLGIHTVEWDENPRGINLGWARMWLKPRDMTKIGLLYLQGGVWEGRQVVPAGWVTDSTVAHADPQAYREFFLDDGTLDQERSIGYWVFANLLRPFSDGYGYQWWIDDTGMYTALGHQGQYIIVVPEQNLVVAFTGKMTGTSTFLGPQLVQQFVRPAVRANEPLAPAPADVQAAWRRLFAPPWDRGEPEALAPLPDVARRISGVTHRLQKNRWGHDNLRLTFVDGHASATFAFDKAGVPRSMEVGLDGEPRRTMVAGKVAYAQGHWADANTFVIDSETMGYSVHDHWTLRFDEDGLEVEERGVTGRATYRGSPAP